MCNTSNTNSNTYQLKTNFPESLHRLITNILINYKTLLNRKLYYFLQPIHKHRIPKFYGLPKIHKPPTELGIPPIRPIVSHTNSLLSHTASFIDHVLQPLARSYPDYLHNSTSLIQTLTDFKITPNTTLISIDVISLYPSIPQSECLAVIYEEMQTHSDLLICDPNLIIQLLHINMTHNYFEFADFTFQQTHGIAMGAAFSPTIANIFMSVLLKKFLETQKQQPVLLKRYIDDIFMLWPTTHDFNNFFTQLNNFHNDLKFTVTESNTSINFLDLTIYKGDTFDTTHLLDVKTFQKPNNLYQYLDFTSFHQNAMHKGLIIGECIRYIRTNTTNKH